MENEVFKLAVQLGVGGIFFYLYWVTNKRMQDQDAKHDQDIARLYDQRIVELKLFARLPTDLEGVKK